MKREPQSVATSTIAAEAHVPEADVLALVDQLAALDGTSTVVASDTGGRVALTLSAAAVIRVQLGIGEKTMPAVPFPRTDAHQWGIHCPQCGVGEPTDTNRESAEACASALVCEHPKCTATFTPPGAEMLPCVLAAHPTSPDHETIPLGDPGRPWHWRDGAPGATLPVYRVCEARDLEEGDRIEHHGRAWMVASVWWIGDGCTIFATDGGEIITDPHRKFEARRDG
ncbi:hypothetical protein ACFVHB_20215 [Kitasatospora sp. NPDC127111]|uniref:hypothetical protein n=1 Tax=Kitasatospora sp. NPDC127111 TaxID=3345363 RepID=UPI00362C6D1F